nr:tetratricopeptide repeat protein [Nonomuraea cypriaca]
MTVDVRAIFSWSYETLADEAAARTFRLVAGLHPGPGCTVDAAASLVGVPVSRVRAPLAELTRANLLTEHAPGQYSCHDLLRAYASELCEARDADRDAARHRVLDHYVHSAFAAVAHLHGRIETIALASPRAGVCVTGFAGTDEAMAWFADKRPALLAALDLAADLGLDRHVCWLAGALFVFLHRRGRWHDRAETQRAAVAAARRLGDPVEEARACRNLAAALADLGRFDDAHHHLDAALEQDVPSGQAWTHYFRNLVYGFQGREADALEAARRAHDLFDRLGDEVGQAIALTTSAGTTGAWETTARPLTCASGPWSGIRSSATAPTRPTRGHASPTPASSWATPPGPSPATVRPSTCSGSSATRTPRPAPSRTWEPATTSPATTRPPASTGVTPAPCYVTSIRPPSTRSTPS